jgi:hypothetical protein
MTGKGMGRNSLSVVMLCCFFFTPFLSAAQTPSGGGSGPPRTVALMPFVGDDLSISAEFQEAVLIEIAALGGYTAQPIDIAALPEGMSFPPDQPPEPGYLGGTDLVMTGEYYIDTEETQHFQMWLWNSNDGSLVYTDEMVFEDMEEALTYLPAIVQWIFSRVAARIVETEKLTVEVVSKIEERERTAGEEAAQEPYNRRFYLGLRGNASLNTSAIQAAGTYEAGTSQWLNGEGAFTAEFRLFRFLSLQMEAAFVYDVFVAANRVQKGGVLIRTSDTFRSMFLMFPLFIKIPLEAGDFSLSPFIGIYYLVPLGKMNISPGEEDSDSGSYSYGTVPPIGVSMGVDVGLPLGPGEITAGLRFDRNIGTTAVEDPNRMQYYRNRFGLSLGYQFLIWAKKR